MAYITRELERKFLKLNDFFKVILVMGARQVGKTTMLKHLAGSDRTYVTIHQNTGSESCALVVAFNSISSPKCVKGNQQAFGC